MQVLNLLLAMTTAGQTRPDNPFNNLPTNSISSLDSWLQLLNMWSLTMNILKRFFVKIPIKGATISHGQNIKPDII